MHGQSGNHPTHGVVSRRELLAAGVGRGAIEHGVKRGRLFLKYRGVYAVGRPDLSVWGERRAIVLACGTGAVLSHRSAAGAWGLRPDGGTRWEVTVPSDRGPGAPVKPYRKALAPHEIAVLDGVPITTVARTLFDLSSLIPIHQERRAIERAVQLELFHLPEVARILDANHGRPGAPALARLLDDFRTHGMTHTRSDLEAAVLQICLDHRLPRPQVNHHDGIREVDFRWPASRVVLEADGYEYHRTRAAFEADRVKRLALEAEGWRVLAVTYRQVFDTPAVVAAALRQIL